MAIPDRISGAPTRWFQDHARERERRYRLEVAREACKRSDMSGFDCDSMRRSAAHGCWGWTWSAGIPTAPGASRRVART